MSYQIEIQFLFAHESKKKHWINKTQTTDLSFCIIFYLNLTMNAKKCKLLLSSKFSMNKVHVVKTNNTTCVSFGTHNRA